MNACDYHMLAFCLDEFRPLTPLTGAIPSGTLDRHVKRLVRLEWLQEEGNLYLMPGAGRRPLVERASGPSWDALARIHAPLALVPTPVHRALIELILSAMVARQHEIRPDRHPFFAAFGSTRRWKPSLGRFLCHAVGLDPAVQVVDCGSEAGTSLSFRRGSDGALGSQRALLETPFVVLDEFQMADRRARSTRGIFLSGRLVMPLQNEPLAVRPVPLRTLNPKDTPTREGRRGAGAPRIRRALLANLDAVPLPALAAVGERAVEAARAHQPLGFAAPRADIPGSHDAIVDLVRAVLVAAAHERVDVDVIANRCAGMTAFIPEPGPAIAQVVHGVGVLAETLGRARPGWIERVSEFGRGRKTPAASTSALTRVVPPATQGTNVAREPGPRTSISLAVPPPPPRRRTSVPKLDLGEALRARRIRFAMETRQNVEDAITTRLDFSLEWRDAASTIETLATILRLGQPLALAAVETETLHGSLTTREQLRKAGCDVEDVPAALRLITVWQALPFSWTWKRAEPAMRTAAAILDVEITLSDLTTFLEQPRQLAALGFDDPTAVAVAEALARARATGGRRDAVLETLVEVPGHQADLGNLEDERQRLEASVNPLIAAEQRSKTSLQHHRDDVTRLTGAVARLNETRGRRQADWDEAAGSLAVAEAPRAFLMGRPAEAESRWASLEALLTWRRRGGRVDNGLGQMPAERARKKIVEFVQKPLQDVSQK